MFRKTIPDTTAQAQKKIIIAAFLMAVAAILLDKYNDSNNAKIIFIMIAALSHLYNAKPEANLTEVDVDSPVSELKQLHNNRYSEIREKYGLSGTTQKRTPLLFKTQNLKSHANDFNSAAERLKKSQQKSLF